MAEYVDENGVTSATGAFGPNTWLIDDMHEKYLSDPQSVSESWREFFSNDLSAVNGLPDSKIIVGGRYNGPSVAPSSVSSSVVKDAVEVGRNDADVDYRPLKGAAVLIAKNMEASLEVPTATSVRQVPAKLLEMEREVMNRYLVSRSGAKVSFTHIIAYAVVKGLMTVPAMRSVYELVANDDVNSGNGMKSESNVANKSDNGRVQARVAAHRHVNLGIAIDMKKAGGERTLLVPVIKNADTLGFKGLFLAYEDLIRRSNSGKLTVDDFQGATATLTNPGTLGTVQSVPRLMKGQSVIVGVGSISYPAELQGADPRGLAELGVSKTVTLTSTYDHRVIQGAESGIFLAYVSECLLGEHGFYDEIFSELDIPIHPARWERDRHAPNDIYELMHKQVQVQRLINMYRVRGHLIADLDPLSVELPPMHAELDPASYGITIFDYDREFAVDGVGGRERMRLGEALDILRTAYCSTLGVEFTHIQDPKQKRWVQDHMESPTAPFDPSEQEHILQLLNSAEAFEHFLHTRYVGQKRFGLEGAESAIVILSYIFEQATNDGVQAAVIGMAHRGRLNVLANIVGMSLNDIFQDFEGIVDLDSVQGSGDVRYHNGAKGIFSARSGEELPIMMASNPSHLEAVDPVVEGMARAIQDRIVGVEGYSDTGIAYVANGVDDGTESAGQAADPGGRSLAVLVHGDAAFAGQGVVAETLEMSQLPGYQTGGTIHLVINNQLGFTTAPQSARSSVYSTDIAKVVQAPIFHVNGDDPEACARAALLAFAFRGAFHKDVVIDMVCYRRHGHNEGDDPSYTQPRMYRAIDQRRSVRKLYAESLVHRGNITIEKAEELLADFNERYQRALDETRALASSSHPIVESNDANHGYALDEGSIPQNEQLPFMIDRDLVECIVRATMTAPDGFTLHPKLVRQFEKREKMLSDGIVDWVACEALAFGSRLASGNDVRLCGQDTRRGTFSQRHAVLVDYESGAEWIPLAHLKDIARNRGYSYFDGITMGRFFTYDSLLSEYAALGFEYGYSVEALDSFVAWEAQFGDFSNGAQVMIDNFIVAAKEKWNQQSGLVMLLPHGYEGQGPEHSSARLERFLTLSANGNIRVAQPTTGAQYYHLLMSTMLERPKVPLVVMTPKSLLRAQETQSNIDDIVLGHFEPVLDDPTMFSCVSAGGSAGGYPDHVSVAGIPQPDKQASVDAVGDPSRVSRVVLCTGKVAYEIMRERNATGNDVAAQDIDLSGEQVAVVRVEQLYPWPEYELGKVLERYPNVRDVMWVQEEPENMGAWAFVHGKLHKMLRGNLGLSHVSRPESGSPASGSMAAHKAEHGELIKRVFARI